MCNLVFGSVFAVNVTTSPQYVLSYTNTASHCESTACYCCRAFLKRTSTTLELVFCHSSVNICLKIMDTSFDRNCWTCMLSLLLASLCCAGCQLISIIVSHWGHLCVKCCLCLQCNIHDDKHGEITFHVTVFCTLALKCYVYLLLLCCIVSTTKRCKWAVVSFTNLQPLLCFLPTNICDFFFMVLSVSVVFNYRAGAKIFLSSVKSSSLRIRCC